MRLVSLVCSAVFAAALVSSAAAAQPRAFAAAAEPTPVPSLTPAATAELWETLVSRPHSFRFATAACTPVRALFYSPTDWLRLATKLAASSSPCAHYYVSVPPLAADKTQLRGDQAWRIRALGPNFHALAEINVTGWTAWVASTGNGWHAAGVEARRRMAAAGFDVAAGDTWALNELSSAVRIGTGNARANMRAFFAGLVDGEGGAAVRGVVWTTGIGQGTSELSVYQARLQDWYEDAAFWSDVARGTSDWSQEVYGDVRNYAVAGAARDTRRDALNEYLQHQAVLAAAAPESAASARSLLAAANAPLANAAWQHDSAFGWTNVPVDLMQDYVSAQTYALRSAGFGRFGFAWSPKSPVGMSSTDFNSQTNALLARLASSIADSAEGAAGACGTTWCNRDLGGATVTSAWRTFGAWKPSRLAFTSAPQTLAPGAASSAVTVQLQTNTGVSYTAGVPVGVTLASSSSTGSFSTSTTGPWTSILTVEIASGASNTSAYYRDPEAGTPTITASAAGKMAATQVATISAVAEPPSPPSGFFVGFAEDLPKEIGADAVEPAKALGASAFRLTLTWSPGQTALTSTEAQKLDRAVAASSGMRIVLAVYGTSADAAPTDATRRDQYCSYVRDVLGRYPSIRDVVIWNEPNKSLFWRPQVNADGSVASAAAYEALLARCWDVLHAADPSVNVLGLALSSTGNDDVGSRSPGDFIRRVGDAYRASGRSSRIFDTVAYHPYPADASERPWRRHIGSKVIGMGDWNKLMYNLWLAFDGTAQPIPGEDGVSLWYTEIGFQTSVPAAKAPAYSGSENVATIPDWVGGELDAPAPAETSPAPDQGTQALDALRLAACQPHVGAFFNFLLADEPILGGWQSGPLWADRTPKGSHGVFRTAIGAATTGSVDCGALKGGLPSSDFMPPAAPTELSATPAGDPLRVELRWTAVPDESAPVSYRIYRGGSWIGTTTETSWLDTGVVEGATYTYTVRAIDAASNLGNASTSVVVTVADLTAPSVSLTAPVEGARVGGAVALQATATDSFGVSRVEFLVGGSVVATVDAPPYTATWASTSGPDGAATLTARAFDAAGNMGSAAARTITVDNTAPETTIASGPADATTQTAADFTFVASEAATFECSLDAAPFAACTSPHTYSGLAVGEHVFRIRARDVVGNVDPSPAERRWTITVADTSPPETTIESGPSGTVTASSASFAFSASEANAAFECRLDAAGWGACISPHSYAGLGAGPHTFEVRARDAAGNTDATPAARTWTIEPATAPDVTAPVVSLTAPASGAFVEGVVAIEATAADDVGVARVELLVDGAVVASDDAAPFATSWSSASVADGTATIGARAFDGAGNVGIAAARTVTVDNTAPETTITSGPTDATTQTAAGFTFAASETATFECSLDAAPFAACASPHTYVGLAVGEHVFRVRARDLVGNAEPVPAERRWLIAASRTEPAPAPAPAPEPAPASAPAPSPAPAPPPPSGGGEAPPVVVGVSRLAPSLSTVTPARVVRAGAVATIRVRFAVSEAARVEARVTPARSTKPLALLRGSVLAGRIAPRAGAVLTARASRAGSYTVVARVATRSLVRGRTYRIRLTAGDAAGERRDLTIRFAA